MHFLRLIRPINLIVVALTMYAMRVFFLPYLDEINRRIPSSEPLDFFLLVLSTVIIAAGGNIINDYFDVKADRVNKPDKVIIGKYIKPRWAIVSHWLLNFTAFAIACYLSWRYGTFWYVFIHLLSINALWFYSMYFKRRFLIGNVMIALLTALVPILCGIHFLKLVDSSYHISLPGSWDGNVSIGIDSKGIKTFFVLFFAFFAASLNLVREIIKDIEDVEGDLLLRAKTLPIVIGKRRSKFIAAAILLVLLIVPIPFILEGYAYYHNQFFVAMAPGIAIIFGIVVVLILTLKAQERQQFKRADFVLKLLMMIGSCFPFYWYFL